MLSRSAFLTLLLAGFASGQDGNEKPPAVDQKAIDRTIEKGVDYLKKHDPTESKDLLGYADRGLAELVLWTLVHAGVKDTEKLYLKLFDLMMKRPLTQTYAVSLQAMILEEIDRVTYQWRIAQCAQFLVDNQSASGLWSYGQPSSTADKMPTGDTRKPTPTAGGGIRPAKPKVQKHVEVKQRAHGPGFGDGSNSQYAMLGLRACHDAGIDLPKDVVRLALKLWQDAAGKDGGWSYSPSFARGMGSTGSMTAGGLSNVVIAKHILAEKCEEDAKVKSGLKWLSDHFKVDENPGMSVQWHYYYLYGLERACIFYGTEKLGSHWWYAEGVKYLLAQQAADGSWTDTKGGGQDVIDTCFAILFLRRAADPIATVDDKPAKATKDRAAEVYRDRLEELRKADGVKSVLLGDDDETAFILVILKSEAAEKRFRDKFGAAIDGVPLRTQVSE